MSFFDTLQWQAPPGLGDYINQMQQWTTGDFRTPSEQWSQKLLNHLYGNNPIKQQKAFNALQASPLVAAAMTGARTGMREADRNYDMSTAMAPGQQAPLIASQKAVQATQGKDNLGLTDIGAVGQALGSVMGQAAAGQAADQAYNMAGMGAWGQGLRDYTLQKKPGLLSQIGQVGQVGSQLAGLGMGIAGLFSPGGGGSSNTGLYSGDTGYGDTGIYIDPYTGLPTTGLPGQAGAAGMGYGYG